MNQSEIRARLNKLVGDDLYKAAYHALTELAQLKRQNADDPLVEACERHGIDYTRGDVLDALREKGEEMQPEWLAINWNEVRRSEVRMRQAKAINRELRFVIADLVTAVLRGSNHLAETAQAAKRHTHLPNDGWMTVMRPYINDEIAAAVRGACGIDCNRGVVEIAFGSPDDAERLFKAISEMFEKESTHAEADSAGKEVASGE